MKPKSSSGTSSRRPPEPTDSHAEIDDWIRRVMPDLNPIVKRLDQLIRDTIPGLQYAVKWKKAYYGLPEQGWIIELVSYDVSVNIVFHGGAKFDDPPSLGSGDSRYVKIKSLDEVEDGQMKKWIEQAAKVPGWK